MKRIREASARLQARLAGALLLLSVLMAALNEFFVRGRLCSAVGLAANLIEVSGAAARVKQKKNCRSRANWNTEKWRSGKRDSD
jgi:hypothetical protein